MKKTRFFIWLLSIAILGAVGIGVANAEPIPIPFQCQCWEGGGLCSTSQKTAEVNYYTWDIKYTDEEWKLYTWIWTITISSGDTTITILDRNLWATTNDITSTASHWYKFQR